MYILQVTLYVPRTILFCDKKNEIILFEQERPPKGCSKNPEIVGSSKMNNALGPRCFVQLVPNHVINGSVPLNAVSKNIENQMLMNMQRPSHEYPYIF